MIRYLAIGLCFIAAGVQAKPFSFLRSLDPFQKQLEDVRTDPETCADFTGQWKGTCLTDAGYETDQKDDIVQRNCQRFTTYGRDVFIGGSLWGGYTHAFPGDMTFIESNSGSLSWDDTHKILIYSGVNEWKWRGVDQGHPQLVSSEMKLVGDKKLAIHAEFYTPYDPRASSSGLVIVNCTYDKQ